MLVLLPFFLRSDFFVVLDACLDLDIVLLQNNFLDYFYIVLAARPRTRAGNQLWHRLYHRVLDETWRPPLTFHWTRIRRGGLSTFTYPLLCLPSDAPAVLHPNCQCRHRRIRRWTVDLVEADRTRWAIEELVAM